jgi:hypothetical protein
VVKQDIEKALELAAACGHPNAVWLTNLFAGHDVGTAVEAREMFLIDAEKVGSSDKEKGRAFCLAGVVAKPWRKSLVREAATLGDALAQALMVKKKNKEKKDFFFCSRK